MRVLLAVCACACASAANPLSLSVSPDGSYALTHSSWPALSLASAPTGLFVSGAWLSSADGSLVRAGAVRSGGGADAWGQYNSTALDWASPSAPSTVLMTTAFRVYADAPAVAFAASFAAGVAATGAGASGADADSTVTRFPAWALPASSQLAWMTWAGPFLNRGLAGPLFGPWSAAAKTFPGGLSGGPLVLFDATGARSLVLSAASEFMAVSAAATATAVNMGVLGSADSLPAGFAYETVAWAGDGINPNVMSWGAALLAKHGKPHGLSKSDYTNTWLGYNSDHGAFYYYNPVFGSPANYSAMLDAVADYATAQSIPYKFVLLDSWWYFKGQSGGVLNWTARPDVFSGGDAGITALVEKTGWKITAHNRYWDKATGYARQNGGNFDFFLDGASGKMGVPLQTEFWTWLLTSKVKAWNLGTYEQDWLYNELEGVTALLTNVSLGRQWLVQMGAGAAQADVSIQLCMSYPRHTLQSVEMPTVTQVRASDDHVPGRNGGVSPVQWNLAYSSLLSWAVGVAPFKDNYWSTAVQPGSSCGANATELTPSLHNAASVLSAGPVTPGDGVGMSDVAQIMRACAGSGRLLQPSRPATALDACIVRGGFPGADQRVGDVSATYSALGGGLVFDHILAANVGPAGFAVSPADLAPVRADLPLRAARAGSPASFTLPPRAAAAAAAPPAVAYSLNATTLDAVTLAVAPFDAGAPIQLQPCGIADFQLFHTAPVWPNGWALLGDLSKYVPVAEARFANAAAGDGFASVDVVGSPGEVVPVTFYDTAKAAPTTVTCTLPDAGVATATVPAGTCA